MAWGCRGLCFADCLAVVGRSWWHHGLPFFCFFCSFPLRCFSEKGKADRRNRSFEIGLRNGFSGVVLHGSKLGSARVHFSLFVSMFFGPRAEVVLAVEFKTALISNVVCHALPKSLADGKRESA